jgi:hypothetical protein
MLLTTKLTWNDGRMEQWNNEMGSAQYSTIPLFQHSSLSFHHSSIPTFPSAP